MPNISDRVFTELGQFNGRLSSFVENVKTTTPDSRLPRKSLDELLQMAERARAAADAIARSFTLIDITSLDIVDMQVRLQGETARLASALRELGKAVAERDVLRDAFGDTLVALDESPVPGSS